MAGKKDLTIFQGASFYFVFRLAQVESDGSETPVDLSNCEARMQIRPNYRSDKIILDVGATGCITVTDPAKGEVTIDIPASITNDLDFSTAVYDTNIIFEDGRTMRLAEGRVQLSMGVTR